VCLLSFVVVVVVVVVVCIFTTFTRQTVTRFQERGEREKDEE
jgi:hypothetical protein